MSFSIKLFLSVMLLFATFVSLFLGIQYQREKSYKAELLHVRLQDYNDRLFDKLKETQRPKTDLAPILDQYIKESPVDSLRITVLTITGEVIYDNKQSDITNMSNHLKRVEIQQALQNGSGYDIYRTSESIGIPYFYSAKCYNNKYIIRSALPYNVSLISSLQVDSHFLWFIFAIVLILALLYYLYIRKLGTSLTRLQEFTLYAELNEPIKDDLSKAFPRNELGEISRHIISIYKRLRETKEALSIEREKLIAHLQTSRQGVGIFTSNKKEVVTNPLFTRYGNLVSDKNLQNSEDIFSIPELKPILQFIDQHRQSGARKSIMVTKNGHTFCIECVLFQDLSFEITFIDITQELEQSDLKRQLTQNAAHELKTPVSSIQGYLETIVNNKNLNEEKRTLFLERCYAQSNRLTQLLRDISLLTRIDEAANMIDMESLNISTVMATILNEVAPQLDKKNIQVYNYLQLKLFIRANPSLIYSIFRNLTDNVITHAGSHISMTIKCFREDEKFFYFSFADTGIGVAEEHLNRLFERFYRIDKGRARKTGGTGLGLAIVKNAVLIHGGNISAKINQGSGVEFIFTLAKDNKSSKDIIKK